MGIFFADEKGPYTLSDVSVWVKFYMALLLRDNLEKETIGQILL